LPGTIFLLPIAGRRWPLREQLKAGYRANAERDLTIAAEWFPLEEEAWRMFESGRERNKIAKTKRT
jgi:hypothetical protein